MKTKKIQKTKILNFNFKNLGNNILDYPYVEIKWLDIEGDAGWSSTKDLKNQKLPVCVSKGYLLSQSKGITRIFTDYIETKEKPTFDNIASGEYPVSRSLFFYVKNNHIGVVDGITEFVEEFVYQAAPDGPLVSIGLIPGNDIDQEMIYEGLDSL